jgi:transcriptional regulator GlxA family with amidase domain
MPRRVVLLAVPPVDELDLIGPMEVFGTANRLLGGNPPPYVLQLVTTARDGTIEGGCGLSLVAQGHYRAMRDRADSVLVICGVEARRTRDRALLGWLGRAAATTRRLGSVCVGAFLLAEAGLLDGRRATVHWRYARELADRYPRVAVDPRPTWLRDGTIYTSAGITAGIDLALAWVEEDLGSGAALRIARELVLLLRRPSGQDQVSVALRAQASETRAIHELQAWMAEHLERPLSVDALARRAAMSARNFARVFARELGTTPARYLRQLRVEAARRLLERTDRSLTEVALASGLGSADVMRRAFLGAVGTTPLRYRHQFETTAAASRERAAPPRGLALARRELATAARIAASKPRSTPMWPTLAARRQRASRAAARPPSR